MDRFKFRVWNIQYGFYCDQMTQMVINSNGVCYDNGVRGDYFEHNGFVIEQCTGLKDKNGNLIYEGDIVIGRKEIVVCEMIEYKDVVEYKDGAYFPFNWTGVYKPEKFEIIGNVHQIKV